MTSKTKWGIGLTLGGAALVVGGLLLHRRGDGGLFGRAQRNIPPVKSKSAKRLSGEVRHYYRKKDIPIEERIAVLQDLVWDGVRDADMRKLALGITGFGAKLNIGGRELNVKGARCPARDGECEAKAIHDWVKENVRYTGDVAPVKMGSRGPVESIDLFQTARRTVEFAGGDCDDQAVLNATLMVLNQIPAKFRVTSPRKDIAWTHIYNTVGLPKLAPSSWKPVDTTFAPGSFGKEPPHGREKDFIV